MTSQTLPKSRIAASLAAGVIFFSATTTTAATVDFKFEPPELPADNICLPRSPDADLLAHWENWDGKSLDGWDPKAVRRDIRRLREIDGVGWYDKIEAAITLLPGLDPGFTTDDAALERIDLMLAAGKLRELQASQLVVQLLAEDHGDSPRLQLALSRFLTLGQGVERDPARGLELLIAAANGGNADALLDLAARQVQGQTIEGWDVSPDLAVTMAFGALVGKLDPMICDRVTRIAREYKNGDVVTRDLEMSERWYRFAANLGDSDAAWKVAEFHMKSDELVKDNDTLISYLKRAAEGNAPFALIALGRVYEIGALVTQDRDHARALYEQAAEADDRAGLMRLVQLLTTEKDDNPESAQAYRAALQRLVAREDSPTWADVAEAELILKEQGRWAGEAAARVLLERAASREDGNAIVALAEMNLRTATDPKTFYAQADQIIHAVTELGMNDPAADLRDAFICRSPAAPQVGEAVLWQQVEQSKGGTTVTFTMTELRELAANPLPQKVAILQSQALYGRATAMAQYMAFLELRAAPQSQIDFWNAYSRRYAMVDQARGRLLLDDGVRGDERQKALEFLRKAVRDGDISAGLPLANALLHGEPVLDAKDVPVSDEQRREALSLLEPLAKAGIGEALALLPLADPARWPMPSDVYADYADIVDARGDFAALLLAMPYLEDPGKRSDYIARATTITDCSFEEVMQFATVMGERNDANGFAHWTKIAAALMEDDGWQMTLLGDKFRQYGTSEQMAAGYVLYEQAHALGSRTAAQRLLALASQPTSREYDAVKAASLYVELLGDATPDEMVKLLRRIDAEDAEIRTLTLEQVSPTEVYLAAAEGGNPVAMREYARLVRAEAAGQQDVQTAVLWMRKAAEQGDAPAMLDYAEMLAFGVGVPASRPDALVWLKRASDKGLEEANVMMQALNLADTQ